MRWYVLSETTGIAMLCANEADARREAATSDQLYPRGSPYIATRLVAAGERDALRAEISAMHDHLMEGRVLMRELASAADGAVLAGEPFPETLNDRLGEWLRRYPMTSPSAEA